MIEEKQILTQLWNNRPALQYSRNLGGGLEIYIYLVYMCFVELEKVNDRVPWDILWELLWVYRVRGALLRAICLPKAVFV